MNACDCHGNTPLHFSCSNGHVDTAAILLYVCTHTMHAYNTEEDCVQDCRAVLRERGCG